MSETTELSVKIEGDELVIRIGAKILAFAATHGPYLDNIVEDAGGKEVEVTDQMAFMRAIVEELHQESEDGTTLVHRMFDKATVRAVENGCEGIELPEPVDY